MKKMQKATAILTVEKADTLTPRKRKDLSNWLRELSSFLRRENNFSRRFRARYFGGP